MKITHDELKKKGVKILLKKGFKKQEIFLEHSIKLKDGSIKILDVAGIKDNKIVGIECGGLTRHPEQIKEVVDELILIPYVKKQGYTFHCSNCDHSWISRVEKPKACPKCKRYFVLNNKTQLNKTMEDKS